VLPHSKMFPAAVVANVGAASTGEGDRALFSYLFSGILTLLAEFFLARYRDKVYNCLPISYRLCAADAGRRNGKEVRRTGERWQACRASRAWSLPTLPIM